MEAICAFETSTDFQRAIRRYIRKITVCEKTQILQRKKFSLRFLVWNRNPRFRRNLSSFGDETLWLIDSHDRSLCINFMQSMHTNYNYITHLISPVSGLVFSAGDWELDRWIAQWVTLLRTAHHDTPQQPTAHHDTPLHLLEADCLVTVSLNRLHII
jgi:hypothetical protein